MKISEASARTGIAARLLRYYEDQGLLRPGRNGSGYREYTEDDLAVAARIRQLLAAGLGTETIRTVLPCLEERDGRLTPVCDNLVAELREERQRIVESIDALAASRDALGRVIDAADAGAA